MHPLLIAALLASPAPRHALQANMQVGVQRDTAKGHTTVTASIGIDPDTGDNHDRRPPKRIPVTEEHLRTAFKSPLARTLLERARTARLEQDSSLMSYEATTYERVSAGMGFSRIGGDHLLFRHEDATHVRWNRKFGAWIDVTGSRTALPVAADDDVNDADDDISGDMPSLPYFPGKEPLITFNGSGMVKASVDERDIVHPLADGAEAYYTYAVGDSVTFHLPNGRAVMLRELLVRPRAPKWNLVVGSLWFDNAGGQLVRAAYRLSVPMDVWAIVKEDDSTATDDVPKWVMPLISPMRAQVTTMYVEYGLYNERFWLPRIMSTDGDAQVSFMHVPFKFEQRFDYRSVNAIDSLPPIQVTRRPQPPDSLSDADREKWRDSVSEVRHAHRVAYRDSVRRGLLVDTTECQGTAGSRTVTKRNRNEGNYNIAVVVPCDRQALARSPDLPASIYDEGDRVFGSSEKAALIAEALAMGAQPPFAFGAIPPTFKWGLEFTRFNRVEGLSTGGLVEQQLGAGYTASLLGRIGVADLEPNVELGLARTNLTKTIRARAYNRLVAANDWGNPLSFGSSVSALLFGRDEGFYYRASGAEIEYAREQGTLWKWRVFAERERTAAVDNTFSLGARFIPNLTAQRASFAGTSFRVNHTHGLDPNGFRVFTDLRLESAISDSANVAYGRGALDLTFSQGIGRIGTALTLSGGSSLGTLPMQRRWFLGGAHTVRGELPDTSLSGNAYWLARAEVGGPVRVVRPVVFTDIGWVGDRNHMSAVGRPMSGFGVGASILDGLIRADLSRGVYPTQRVRFDMYVEARF
jgi:hypothetical protein